jgi:hypothetical protein
VIDDPVARVARAAAEELVPRYGPRLAAEAEAAIHAGGQQARERTAPDQYFDPVALGALIVAIAQFGYQVYSDRKGKGQQPTREAIAQAIRIERRKHSDLTGEEAEVIDIVSAKIIESGDSELPGLANITRAGGAISDGLGVAHSGLLSRPPAATPHPGLLCRFAGP